MVKISIILSFLAMLFGCILASRMCKSCGSECAPACGTRYFRSCCFNYLRKKRGPDNVKLLKQNHEWKADGPQSQWATLPVIALEDNLWKEQSDMKLDHQDEAENVLQAIYM